ncbi:D-aminoacyl-tRNA deacylase 1-like [Anopheles maculipalpis]|uniref:D-aminoacyl-tRNA deacylase 1-like n=1 Tax=Anopheles maculipalpis TaxID=1496333 RepID=UPI0021590F0F|nr:D-aminoacyl-tRNA deacylase 1-like [Anopheles maculipalpis]
MQGPAAQELYGSLLKQLRDQYSSERIRDGRFGAMMQVHIQNDGPVTLEIESPAQSEQERSKLQRKEEHKAKSAGKSFVASGTQPEANSAEGNFEKQKRSSADQS